MAHIDWTGEIGDKAWQAHRVVDDVPDMPVGITKDSDSFTTTQTKVWLSGGTAEARYQITNQIVTVGSRIEKRSISLYCTET